MHNNNSQSDQTHDKKIKEKTSNIKMPESMPHKDSHL